MIVCVCANQNDRQVKEGITRSGCVKTYKRQSNACQQCCKCKQMIDAIALEVLGKNTV